MQWSGGFCHILCKHLDNVVDDGIYERDVLVSRIFMDTNLFWGVLCNNGWSGEVRDKNVWCVAYT